jgi:cell division protein FtsL
MARGATAAARTRPTPAHPAPAVRPAPARRAPARRRSGPARAASAPRPRRQLPLAALAHSLSLDRLLRGRGWIALVGVLLVGIVFFNVSLLELNSGIARTSERASTLKRENARLRVQLARLGSSERIQRVAAARGLVLPAPGEVRYLRARYGDARRAAKRITSPQRRPAPAPVPAGPAPTKPAETAPTGQAPPTTETTPDPAVPEQPQQAQPQQPAPSEPAPAGDPVAGGAPATGKAG